MTSPSAAAAASVQTGPPSTAQARRRGTGMPATRQGPWPACRSTSRRRPGRLRPRTRSRGGSYHVELDSAGYCQARTPIFKHNMLTDNNNFELFCFMMEYSNIEQKDLVPDKEKK
jgi:hypothetical protein